MLLQPTLPTVRQLRIETAFDCNGVFYHIATAGSQRAYENPHTTCQVHAAMSSVCSLFHLPCQPVQSIMLQGVPEAECAGSAHRVVQWHHPNDQPSCNITEDIPGSWCSVDLGERRSLVVTDYCLRADHGTSTHESAHEGSVKFSPRNWCLQGSLDGAQWVTLRRHDNDSSLTMYSIAAWPVADSTSSWRHFRIYQHGPNSHNTHHLCLTGFEMYGYLTDLFFY